MEKFRNLSPSSRTLVIASGVVCVSLGTYAIYKLMSSQPRNVKSQYCDRQPSENVDDTDYNEDKISSSGKKILVLGLEKSGKSCLLAALSNQETPREYQPTLGFNVVCITNVDRRLDIMEIGGSKKYKDYWSSFVKDVDILMYVIDSCDKESLPNAFDALNSILEAKDLAKSRVLIVFSKRDSQEALPMDDLLKSLEDGRFRNWNFQHRSVMVRCGGAPKTEGVIELQETLINLR